MGLKASPREGFVQAESWEWWILTGLVSWNLTIIIFPEATSCKAKKLLILLLLLKQLKPSQLLGILLDVGQILLEKGGCSTLNCGWVLFLLTPPLMIHDNENSCCYHWTFLMGWLVKYPLASPLPAPCPIILDGIFSASIAPLIQELGCLHNHILPWFHWRYCIQWGWRGYSNLNLAATKAGHHQFNKLALKWNTLATQEAMTEETMNNPINSIKIQFWFLGYQQILDSHFRAHPCEAKHQHLQMYFWQVACAT